MTEEQRQYLETMESMFQSLGWKVLQDEISGWMAAISSQWESVTPENLRFIQGRYDGLKQIASFQQSLENFRAELEKPAELNHLESYE